MFLRFIITSILLTLCSACNAKELETQIFLIPEGYVGELKMIYGVSSGEAGQYENEARVYEINSQGVHITQLEFAWGKGTRDSFRFYYVDGSGNRTPILLSDLVRGEEMKRQVEDLNTYIIDSSSGSIGSYPCDFDTKSFYVGSYKDILEGKGVISITDYLIENPDPCIKASASQSPEGCSC